MIIWYCLMTLAIVAADQGVKLWAVRALGPGGSMGLIPGVFHLTYAENRGAAFSILEGRLGFFVAVTVAMVGLLLYMAVKGYIRGSFGKLATVFIIGGALGNLTDRLCRGYVVDLFDFRLIHFAIFNVADVFITIGGVMLAIYFIFLEGKNLEESGDGNQEPESRL